jgi:hypothetical protein
MAKGNVHEMKTQDNGQPSKDAVEFLRGEAWDIGEELRHWSAKIDMLADVEFSGISDNGAEGIVYYLREMAERMEILGDKLSDACKGGQENG